MLGNLTGEISPDDHHYQRIASPPCMAPEQMDHFDPSANLQKVGRDGDQVQHLLHLQHSRAIPVQFSRPLDDDGLHDGASYALPLPSPVTGAGALHDKIRVRAIVLISRLSVILSGNLDDAFDDDQPR